MKTCRKVSDACRVEPRTLRPRAIRRTGFAVTIAVSMTLAVSLSKSHGQFAFQQVAWKGQVITDVDGESFTSPIASLGRWCSINDEGQIGFKVTLENGENAILRATPRGDGTYDYKVIRKNDASRAAYSDYVGINATGSVSYRVKVAGFPISFRIRRDTTNVAATMNPPPRDYFTALLSPTDISAAGDGMVSFFGFSPDVPFMRFEQIRRGDGSAGSKRFDSTIIASEPNGTAACVH